MIINFDVPKLTLPFACLIRDQAQAKGCNNWSIITVDLEGTCDETPGETLHYVMIRDLDKGVFHDLYIPYKEELAAPVAISTEVI